MEDDPAVTTNIILPKNLQPKVWIEDLHVLKHKVNV